MLDSVEYDADDDQLSLEIATRDREDAENCTQALREIWYRARVYFDGGAPDNVSVTHDGDATFGASTASDSASAPG